MLVAMPQLFSSERIIELTRQLVAINSVVGTAGETALGDHLEQLLQRETSGLPGISLLRIDRHDDHKPPTLLALWRSPQATRRTIILMGHYDVVGLEPYASLEDLALDSEALRAAYAAGPDPQMCSAAADPDWVFGRGWLDMKSGIAVNIELFLGIARRNELPLNLLLLLCSDEESQSRGLYAALPELNRLQREDGLEYIQVVNTDFCSPLFEGDNRRYLYSGTVGKFTLGLSVFGTTTHVGETFGGVNSSALAGYLAYALEHDRRFLQGYRGEWLPPPTVLHLADNRTRYDTMTTSAAALYANVFNLEADHKKLWRDILHELQRLLRRYDSEMRKRYNRFSARANLAPVRDKRPPELIDFATLLQRVAAHSGRPADELLSEARSDLESTDERQAGIEVVTRLVTLLPQDRSIVVASLLHPWYTPRIEQDQARLAVLREVCDQQALTQRHIYPYISDMSAFAWREGVPEILGQQSPLDQTPDSPELLAGVSCPVLNIGPFGIGAHTGQERSRLGWLSEGLPAAIQALIEKLAN
jgi:arginine utilization protein RocB